MYRLAADVFNDAAMILDCLSPAFPRTIRVLVLSSSSVLRALCGVAAGSSKASLSAHFARWGNLGELNAVSGSVMSFATVKTQPWLERLKSRDDYFIVGHVGKSYMVSEASGVQSFAN